MPSIRTTFLAFATVTLATAPTLALAQGPALGTRLVYMRGPGAEGCPDEQALRDVVAAFLGGADPFASEAAGRLDVTIVRRERDFAGYIVLYAEDGRVLGPEEIAIPTCAALVRELGLSIAIALRPIVQPADPAPAPPLASTPPPSPLPPAPPPARATGPDVAPPPARGLRLLQVGAGAGLGGGFAPALSVGFGGFVGVRWPAVSLSVEGRADLPASTEPAGEATFRTSWLGGTLLPCWHHGWFLACGLVSAGRVRTVASASATPEDRAAGYLGFGGRVGLEAPFSSRFAGQITTDILVNVVRPTIRLEQDQVWSVAAVSELAALRLVAFF